MPKVSIIIVNWNTKDLTEAAISTLFRFENREQFEIILVDNASTDGSREHLANRYPEIEIIANPDNRGFAAANNQGASKARGEYLLLFNSDALLIGPILQSCLEAAEDESPCILGCRILNKDLTLQLSADSFPTIGSYLAEILAFPGKSLQAKLTRLENFTARVNAMDWITGAFILVEKSVYIGLGGLREDIFMYGEDMEFCHRAGKAGIPCYYMPTVSIVHLGGGSIDYSSLRALTTTDMGRISTFKAIWGNRQALALRGVFILRSFLRVAFNLVPALSPKGNTSRRKLANHFREILILSGLRAR